MSTIEKLIQRSAPATPLTLGPLNATSLRDQAYALLKNAIADTDIYDPKQELRLDERQLTTALLPQPPPLPATLTLRHCPSSCQQRSCYGRRRNRRSPLSTTSAASRR